MGNVDCLAMVLMQKPSGSHRPGFVSARVCWTCTLLTDARLWLPGRAGSRAPKDSKKEPQLSMERWRGDGTLIWGLNTRIEKWIQYVSHVISCIVYRLGTVFFRCIPSCFLQTCHRKSSAHFSSITLPMETSYAIWTKKYRSTRFDSWEHLRQVWWGASNHRQ